MLLNILSFSERERELEREREREREREGGRERGETKIDLPHIFFKMGLN